MQLFFRTCNFLQTRKRKVTEERGKNKGKRCVPSKVSRNLEDKRIMTIKWKETWYTGNLQAKTSIRSTFSPGRSTRYSKYWLSLSRELELHRLVYATKIQDSESSNPHSFWPLMLDLQPSQSLWIKFEVQHSSSIVFALPFKWCTRTL